MGRLVYVIVFTPQMESMRAFYQNGIGLRSIESSAEWISFDSAGATLALHPLSHGGERTSQLSFQTSNLGDDLDRLRRAGIVHGEIHQEGPVRFASFQDPEGNWLALQEGPIREGQGPAMSQVIVNCKDLPAALTFYREHMRLAIAREAPRWVELDSGPTRLALHARPPDADHPLHAAQPVAWCLQADDLDRWADEIRGRGLHFATSPTDEAFGLYAEVLDPDGNVLVLREPLMKVAIEEVLAEAFEGDETTHAMAMRKPVKKGAKAVSRVALRPDYRETHPPRPHDGPTAAAEGEGKAAARPAATRGAGANRTRKAPKTRTDTKRARAKPAIGRKNKAERRTFETQKSAAASASKAKPVKRKAAPAKRRAAPAKGRSRPARRTSTRRTGKR